MRAAGAKKRKNFRRRKRPPKKNGEPHKACPPFFCPEGKGRFEEKERRGALFRARRNEKEGRKNVAEPKNRFGNTVPETYKRCGFLAEKVVFLLRMCYTTKESEEL